MQTLSSNIELPELAPLIHQAVLDPQTNEESLFQICDIAKHFNFSGLCTNLSLLSSARKRLGPKGSTKLISVIAFPFGAIPSTFKKAEAEWAAEHGAEELEVVPNFFLINQNKYRC